MLLLLLCLPALSACSKDKLKELADTVQKEGTNLVKESKKMTDALVEPAKEELPETGRMVIKTAEPIEIDQAVVTMHVVGDGRKNSLQITSYPPGAERASAPAVFLHGTTTVETVALLAGKSLSCNLFVEPKAGAPIARNEVGRPVSVTFGSMNMQEKTMVATIEPCTLIGSDDQPLEIGGGEILAVVIGN
ncbi:hypothetical protein Enr13x_55290 [Stieleria neptunia]|uniref:Uncharacterized protein n=1 Tax=Stieleria neptunia TaxID=2527979 RepID=A0A518HXR1_9BACT|nr:hypothetical protein Enr13x_55290 [Stieleria neptunia]